MRELLRTNDAVLISWATAMLASEGIETVVLDGHTAALEGSIGAIPRRIMVDDIEARRARRILEGSAPDGVAIAGFAPGTDR